MSDDSIQRIPIEEFRRLGFLQEANRLFFHPLGLALEVVVDDDGTMSLGGVWDYRSDPEGMFFSDLSSADDVARARMVAEELERHVSARHEALGVEEVIQPIGHSFAPATPAGVMELEPEDGWRRYGIAPERKAP